MKPVAGKVVKILVRHIVIFAALATLAFVIGCPLKRITGINCPLCGATRAQLMLLKGDVELALSYHPMALVNIPLLLIAAHARIIKRYTGSAILVLLFISAIVIYAVAHVMRDKAILDEGTSVVIDWGTKLIAARQ